MKKSFSPEEYEKKLSVGVISGDSPVAIKAAEKLALKSGEEFLDAGCGTGNLLVVLEKSRTKAKLHGVDYSKKSIAVARKRLKKTELKEGSVTKLPYKSGVFDKVAVIGVLLYLSEDDMKKAAREVSRVTKKKGFLLVRNNQPLNRFGNLALRLLGRKRVFTDSYYSPKLIIKTFEEKGFKALETEHSSGKREIDCIPLLNRLFASAWMTFRKQ
jgi:ubiquinone/menaquinone biosynthesis C-methylase UbiE